MSNLAQQFIWPVGAALAAGGLMVALGVRVWASGICFALCAWVAGTIIQEFVRGAKVRKETTGTDLLTALVGLFGRSRRRYAGYIVHLGIVVMFFGFAGEGFKNEITVNLVPGQQATLGHFTIRHDALRVTQDAQKQMITGHVTVFDGGEQIATMTPAKWFFNRREQEPTTEVAIRRAVGEDLYIVLAGFKVENQSGDYMMTINPLVNWVWVGLGIMVIGSIISMLPETMFVVAMSKVPAGAATTSLLVLMLLVPTAGVRAHEQVASEAPNKSELKKKLEGELMCMCGGCNRPMNDCPMEPHCHGLAEQRPKIAKLVDAGMDHDAVIAAFVQEYGGQHVLAAPIDRGFNRLLWLFPYLLGAAGAVGIAVAAVKWSRRQESTANGATAPQHDALSQRLDDELRDLD